VGLELSVEQGYAAAKIVGLRCPAEIRNAIGDLNRVEKIVKVNGHVNSASGFMDQPRVVDGASALFQEIFGEKREHAHSSIGVTQLPDVVPVEIEVIALIK
jgi:enamine deaminase RidA (YjgF/YER057c/UK114 family)